MPRTPTACHIIIGNEILSGRTQEKNLQWLAVHLNEIGVQMVHARVIPDIEATIIETVNAVRACHDYVFTTGGIGPTHDDITARSIAHAFGVPLERHAEAERRLRAHYAADDLNAARLKMADIPASATLIDNPVSAAPGFRIENVFVLAGVPVIMQAMFAAIKDQLGGGAPTLSRGLETTLTEGTIAAQLTDIDTAYKDVDIGCYPLIKGGKLGATIILRATNATALDTALTAVQDMLTALGGTGREVE